MRVDKTSPIFIRCPRALKCRHFVFYSWEFSELAPKNIALLAERDRLQKALDKWHQTHPGPIRDMAAYRAFLSEIGYLQPVPEAFR